MITGKEIVLEDDLGGGAPRGWRIDGEAGSAYGGIVMNATETIRHPPAAAEAELPLAERLALAQAAFDKFFPLCFWSWDPKTRLTDGGCANKWIK